MPRRGKARWLPVLGAAGIMVLGVGVALASEGEGGHASQWWDLAWRIMNFVVLAVVVVAVARKPLKSALKNRIEGIKEELEILEKKREEAKREFALMEQRVKDAAGERDTILAEFRAQGEREKQKIIETAQKLAERIKSQAQFTIEQETSQAKAQLKREIAELSASLAEDLLKQNINAEDQSRLVEEYLAKVQQEVQ